MKKLRLIFFLLLPQLLIGQKNLKLNISFFNEATAIPYTKLISIPIHPGIQVGTEFNLVKKNKTRLFQTAELFYFYHQYLNQAIGLQSELGYEFRFPFGLALESLVGIGYTHTFTTADEYTFSNGSYQKKKDVGNPRVTPSFSIGMGYYLKKNSKTSPELFLRYQSWVEYPYSPGFIPLMTHIQLHIGARFIIQTKNKKNE